jgi:hypothetical protein
VLQQVLGRRSLIRILDQAFRDEILELLAILSPFKSGSRHLRDLHEHLHWMFPRIGRFPVDQFYRRDPQGPDIRFEVVSRLLYHFWRHPERRAHKRVSQGPDIDELGGDTEVGEFHFSGLGQEDVGCFDVSM